MKHHSLCLFIFTVVIGLSATASASHHQIQFISYSRGWAPFEFVEGRNVHGLSIDLFYEVMPKDITKIITPNPEPEQYMFSKTWPIYTRLEAVEWQNTDNLWWSDPVLPMKTVLYSSIKNPVEYNGPKSLSGKTIGCVKGYYYPKMEAMFASQKAIRHDVPKEILLFQMLKEGRIDAIIMDDVTALWLLHNTKGLNANDYHLAKNIIDSVQLRFLFNKARDWEKQLETVNENILKIKENGRLEELISKYR